MKRFISWNCLGTAIGSPLPSSSSSSKCIRLWRFPSLRFGVSVYSCHNGIISKEVKRSYIFRFLSICRVLTNYFSRECKYLIILKTIFLFFGILFCLFRKLSIPKIFKSIIVKENNF